MKKQEVTGLNENLVPDLFQRSYHPVGGGGRSEAGIGGAFGGHGHMTTSYPSPD